MRGVPGAVGRMRAVKHIIGGDVDHKGSARRGPLRDGGGAADVQALRAGGIALAHVGAALGGGVDDDVRREPVEKAGNGIGLRQVQTFQAGADTSECGAGHAPFAAADAGAQQRPPQQAGGARDQDVRDEWCGHEGLR